MLVKTIDAKQALRIVLDYRLDIADYACVEVEAKLPILETLLHEGWRPSSASVVNEDITYVAGKISEFAIMICATNLQLKLDLLHLALKLGHLQDFFSLFALLGVRQEQLRVDPNALFPQRCSMYAFVLINFVWYTSLIR